MLSLYRNLCICNIKKCSFWDVNLNLTLDESSIVFSTKTTDSMHFFIFYKLIGNFEALGLVSGIFPG